MSDELENKIRELAKKLNDGEFGLHMYSNRKNKVQEFIELEQLYKLYLDDKYPDEVNDFNRWFDANRIEYSKVEESYINAIVVKKLKLSDEYIGDNMQVYNVIEAEYLCKPITFTFVDYKYVDSNDGIDLLNKLPRYRNMSGDFVENIVFEYEILTIKLNKFFWADHCMLYCKNTLE